MTCVDGIIPAIRMNLNFLMAQVDSLKEITENLKRQIDDLKSKGEIEHVSNPSVAEKPEDHDGE